MQKSEYDFCFYYRDGDNDEVTVSNNSDFEFFYNDKDLKSTTRHLFFTKNEDNNKIKVYDEIIKNKNFKNISITVYIKEDLKANNEEEEKKMKKKKEENNHIENNLNLEGDKKNNGEVNNDCPCCNCCLDCFNHCWKKKL